MRKYKTTVILFILLAVSIMGYVIVNNTKSTDAAKKIYNLEGSSISEVSIAAGENVVKLVEKDGKWVMVEPKEYKIDEYSIGIMVKKLENLEIIRNIEKKSSDLDKYGLAHPFMTVSFKLQDGMGKVLFIGNETVSKYQYYIKDSVEDAIYTISNTDVDAFEKGDPSGFRDRNFLSVDKAAINSLSFDIAGKRELKLEEYEAGKWRFLQPCEANAKNDAVIDILKKVGVLKIKDFIEDKSSDPGKYGLDKPLYTLCLGDKGGKTQTIYFGKPTDDKKSIYIRLDGNDGIYTVSTEEFNPGIIKLAELLNESPLSIGIGKVNRIVINDNGTISEYKRDISAQDDIFTFNGKQINSEDFNALYVDIMALTSEGYDSGDTVTSPQITILYELNDGQGSIKMDLFVRDQSTYFFSVNNKPTHFFVSTQKVELVKRWIKKVENIN